MLVKYCREFCRARTRERLLWQGPEAIVRVNYRFILSSEWLPQLKEPEIVKRENNMVMGSRWEPDTTID
jgi:hypothetical protein